MQHEISKYIYRLFTIVQSGQAKVAMTTGCNCCLKRGKTVRNRGDSFDSEPFYGELPVLISRGQRDLTIKFALLLGDNQSDQNIVDDVQRGAEHTGEPVDAGARLDQIRADDADCAGNQRRAGEAVNAFPPSAPISLRLSEPTASMTEPMTSTMTDI